MAAAQTVTILFTDLVESTELLQRSGDERAQRIFKAHHRLLSDAVSAHGGHEVKWLGDGLMVAFPSAVEAVRCAIAMQQASRRPAAGERLSIRAGLNVGEAIVDESDYFGTAVVIARRLCDKAATGEIYASETVARLLDGRREFDIRDVGALALKGIDTPVAAVQMQYEHDPLAMLSHTPFVGRSAEIAALEKRLVEAQSGAGGVALIGGEPGIGKTRLAEEFCDHARSSGALVLGGRCYEGDWAPPFSPFNEALRDYASSVDDDTLQAALRQQADVLARIVPSLRERLPGLAEPPSMPPESERYLLLEAVEAFVGALAENRPVVLLLDDLHWADAGTSAMLRHVARTMKDRRVMIVGTYREAELAPDAPLASIMPALARETRVERIALAGLETGTVGDLLDIIAEQDVPDALTGAIARETGGNPFFIREVLLHLVEEGKVRRDDGGWASSLSVAEMGIPAGVREVIGRRVARLGEPCVQMLTAASAMTGGFSWAELRAISPAEESALLDALDGALNARLIIESGPAEYDFTHALVRHTLYDALSTPRRALLHRQIAEALEKLHEGGAHVHMATLAEHFAAAAELGVGDVEKALTYLSEAGDRAIANISYEQAVQHFSRAVALLESRPSSDLRRRAELLIRVGLARLLSGLPSIDTFVAAAEVAKEAKAPDLMVRALAREPSLGDTRPTNGAYWPLGHKRVHPLINEAIEMLGDEPSPLLAVALALRWYAKVWSDPYNPPRAEIERAEEIARGVNHRLALAYVLYWMQFPRNPDGTRERLDKIEEALHVAESAGDRPLTRACLMWRAFHRITFADPRGEDDLRTFHEMSEEFRVPQTSWWSNACMAGFRMMQGDLAEGERFMLKATTYSRDAVPGAPPETGDAPDIAATLSMQLFALRALQGRLGEITHLAVQAADQFPDVPAWRAAAAVGHLASGQVDEARGYYERTVAGGIESMRSTLNFDITLPFLAELCASFEDRANAAELYDMLMPFAGRMLDVGWRLSLGPADRLLGLLAALMERHDDAERHFEEALAVAARISARPYVVRTKIGFASMLMRRRSQGDTARARTMLGEALALARDIGMAGDAVDAERMLDEL